MTTKVFAITTDSPEVEVPLRGKGIGNSLEVGFQGDIGGGTIGVFRRYYDDAGNQIGSDVPVPISWADQTASAITAECGGLSIQDLIPEDSLVFTLADSTDASGNIILLGLS